MSHMNLCFCFSYSPTHTTGFHGIVNLTYLEFPQTLHECDAQLSFHGEQTSRGRFYSYCSTPRHQIIEENIKFGFTLQRRPFLFNYTNNNSNRSGEFWINVKGLYKNMIIMIINEWKVFSIYFPIFLFYSCSPPWANIKGTNTPLTSNFAFWPKLIKKTIYPWS